MMNTAVTLMSQEKEDLQIEKSGSANYVTIREPDKEVTKEETMINNIETLTNCISDDDDEEEVEVKSEVKKEKDDPFTLCLVDEKGGVLETYVRINDEMVPVEEPKPGPFQRNIAPKKRKGRPPKVVSRRALLKKKLNRQKVKEDLSLNYKEVFCEPCDLGFKGIKEFGLHLKKHHINVNDHGYICCHCGYQVGLLKFGHISRHVRQVHCCKNDRPYLCTICSLRFFDKKSLLRHMHVHTPLGPYQCNYCSYSHTDQTVLNKHLKIHMQLNGPKPYKSDGDLYQCDDCGYKTLYRTSLIRHIERHLNIRNYKCEKCVYTTFCKGDLDKHFSCHTNVRAYECDICSKSYKRRSHLVAHIDLKHSTAKSGRDNLPSKVEDIYEL